MPDLSARDERGAVAVTVAIFLSVLLIAVGMSLDVGNQAMQHNRAQTAADNGALAVARDCALRKVSCTSSGGTTTAGALAAQNLDGAGVTATVDGAAGTVKVTVSKSVANAFLGLGGSPRRTVSATAKAKWNQVPVKGVPILPFAISWCDYRSRLPGSGAAPALFRSDLPIITGRYRTCQNATGTGNWQSWDGAVWLTDLLGLGGCNYSINILARLNATVSSIIGTPLFCASKMSSLVPGKTYLVPIYRTVTWVPALSDLTLEVVGFAPIKVRAWRFAILGLLPLSRYYDASVTNCSNGILGLDSCTGITGTFERTIQKDPDFEYGTGTDLGAARPVLVGE